MLTTNRPRACMQDAGRAFGGLILAASVLAAPALAQTAAPAPVASAGETDEQAEWRDAYEQAIAGCAARSGIACETAGHLADSFVPPEALAGIEERYFTLGCQLMNARSCNEMAQRAANAGRRAEAWAFATLAEQISGNDPVGNAIWVASLPTLPAGGGNPARYADRFDQSPRLHRAIACAAYWANAAPEGEEATAWAAAAEVAGRQPDAEAGRPMSPEQVRTWIEDIRITWVNTFQSSELAQTTQAQCQLGLGDQPLMDRPEPREEQ
jgi:hypothetical protein